MLEEINLECMNVYAEKAQNGTSNIQISMDEVYESLTNEMKGNIETVGGTSKISLVDSTQSSITLLNDAEAIGSTGTAGQNTVNIEVKEEKNSTSYYLKANGMYYPMSIRNLKVELDEENASSELPLGAGSLGSGIEITFIDSGETEEKTESDYVTASKNGTIITLTAKANVDGSTQVVVRDGSVTLLENINVIVNPTYTINIGAMTNGSIGISTNGIDTTLNRKYGKGIEIQLKAIGATAPIKYAFEKWDDDTSAVNPRKITVNETTVQVVYIATFVESKLYGAQVLLNGGNPIAVKGNNTIDDNWKLFYIDDDDDGYVHLIYGDYYPADVQTEITSENTIYAPALNSLGYDSSYLWSVNSGTNRLALLKYLKNNENYVETDLDTSIPIGSYDSWTNLASALTGTGKALNGKTIRVQGAPNITMWVKSWNEQGNGELVLGDSGNITTGYRIARKEEDSEQQYYLSYTLTFTVKGYADALYLPYTDQRKMGENSKMASGYWLASPADNYPKDGLCGVRCSYKCEIGSQYNYNANYSSKVNYKSESFAARPVVSILKSDFQELFSTISIQK